MDFQALTNGRNILLSVWGWRGLLCVLEKAGSVCWPCICLCVGNRRGFGAPLKHRCHGSAVGSRPSPLWQTGFAPDVSRQVPVCVNGLKIWGT